MLLFLDDDEVASTCWLKELHAVTVETGTDGVFGPVLPQIPESFPDWMPAAVFFTEKASEIV